MADVLDRLKTALADRYRIERELGSGGMATVYLAEDLKHRRQVALKLLRPELGAVLGGERFLREIHVAAGLNHPHILALHDSGEVDGLLYYVMPYVAGESLRQRLERQTQLSIEEAIEVARQVAAALDYAHRQGVIHRDIKPENILLQEGEAVVADFGIARALRVAGGERLTETGLSLGTPAYMSPEQASGNQDLDSRSDVYSLACVMYEMLAGDPPFTGPTAPAIIARQMVDPVPSLRTVRPTVPEELERAIEQALAKVPADRYDTAGAFVEAAGAAAQIQVMPTRERRIPHRRAWPRGWRVGVPVALAGAATITAGVLLLLSDRLGGGPPQFTVSNIRQVTRAPEVEWDPAISPDGREVAYAAGLGLDMHIFVRDLSGGRSLPLTADRPGRQVHPRWTPDGRSIAFFELGAGLEAGAHRIPRFGGAARAIAPERVWATHGDRVVYIRGDSLVVRSVEGGEETFIASVQPGYTHSAAWSPDGTKLAYVQGNSSWINVEGLGNVAASSVWLVGVDGGEPVKVTDDAKLNVSPAWIPDGRHLLFISNRDGPRDIYAVRVDASRRNWGRPVRVTTGLSPHSISVSADGSKVAYSHFTIRQNIWEIAIPETGSVSLSDARPVTEGNQIVENHGLSRDGRWLAFDSNLDGNQDIYVMPVEGGEPRQVTSDPGDDMHPDFSPDGSEIVFYSTRHGYRDVFLISADGRSEVRLTDGPGEDYHPSFSPDGLRIAFYRESAAHDGVYVMSRDSLGGEWTAPELLTRNATCQPYARWSPDGSRIACIPVLTQQVWTISLQGEERLLFDGGATGLSWTGIPDWSADGRLIYFNAMDSTGAAGQYAIPAAGGIPRQVIRFDDPTKNVSRLPYWPYSLGDGKVYFSVKEIESDIYVMDLEMR
jgi:serine/threonine-protein kinase